MTIIRKIKVYIYVINVNFKIPNDRFALKLKRILFAINNIFYRC